MSVIRVAPPASALSVRHESLRAVIVRRALPVVASVASVVVASLAAERALASLTLRAASSLGVSTVLAPPQRAEAAVLHVLTETTIIERVTTRRR